MAATDFMKKEVEELKSKGLDWKIRVLQSKSVPHSIVDGKNTLILCSNNYLNLSSHPKLIKAAVNAAKEFGAGSGIVLVFAT